jgi:thioredoxin reductase (NADPH)
VDDDSDVLRPSSATYARTTAPNYRIIGSDSPEGALELLKQLKVRNDSVALLLVDQRMPHMDGVGRILQEAMRIFPDAKRALLTAYADTNAAISAINQANINYFFMKPWDPPTEHLYPQLDDLLDDWRASYRPAFEGIRVWARAGRRDRTNCGISWRAIAFPISGSTWKLSANDPETKHLLEALGPEAASFPSCCFRTAPNFSKACRRTWRKGLACGRARKPILRFGDHRRRPGRPGRRRVRRVGRLAHGDDRARSARRPGGNEFAHRKLSWISDGAQWRRSGAPRGGAGAALWRGNPFAAGGCQRSRTEGPYRIVKLADGNEISCHALMIATGVQWRRLEAPGIDRLAGRGRLLRRRRDGSAFLQR